MNERLKKILLVLGFIATVALIGAGLYFLFFRAPAVTPVAEEEGEEEAAPLPGTLPRAGEAPPRVEQPAGEGLPPASRVARGGVTQTTALQETPVSHLTLASDGKSVNAYNPTDGLFYRVDENGNASPLSAKKFPQVQDVAWNRTGEKAVMEFPDGTNIAYDFATQSQVTLPKHWEDFHFSPSRDEFVSKSLALDPDNRWVVVSNADGSNVKAVQALGQNQSKAILSWSPNDQVIGFADTAEPLEGGLDRKRLIPFGKNKENFRGLVVEGLFFQPSWSPSGKNILYSVAGDYAQMKPLLWASSGQPSTMGDNRRSLGLNTWVDKCAFGSETEVFCAVPVNLPPNAGLQRRLFEDYPDHLYKVDLSTGSVALVAQPEKATTMETPRVSADGSKLFFINRETKKLEMIRLK